MPQILYTGSPLAHPLQGLSDVAQGFSEGMAQRQLMDAMLQDAAIRHLLAQNADARAQEDQDWKRTQRPIEARQRDALFDLNKRKAEQELERGQLQLDSYKGATGANYDQAVYDDYDAYVADQLNGLSGEDSDPAALQALQAKIKTRRSMLENAGLGIIDPQKRAAAKNYVARMLMSPLRDEVSPLVREQVRRQIDRIGRRGHLSPNSRAASELEEMRMRLDMPGTDPRQLRNRISELNDYVSQDLAYQGEVESVRNEIAGLQGQFGTYDARAELARLDALLQTGTISPSQYRKQAIELALRGTADPREIAWSEAVKALGKDATPEEVERLANSRLRFLGQLRTEAVNPSPMDKNPLGLPPLEQNRGGTGSLMPELPGANVQSSQATAAPSQDMAAQGSQAGGQTSVEDTVRELMKAGKVEEAKAFARANDKSLTKPTPIGPEMSQEQLVDSLYSGAKKRTPQVSDIRPEINAPKKTAPEKPRVLGDEELQQSYDEQMDEVVSAIDDLKKYAGRRDAKAPTLRNPQGAPRPDEMKFRQEDVAAARARLDQIVEEIRAKNGGRLRVDVEDLLKSVEGLK